jgi:hypothetical protein
MRIGLGLYVAYLSLVTACHGKATRPTPSDRAVEPVAIAAASFEQPKVHPKPNTGWVAIGGGGEPISNQVSLAQDIALLQSTLASPGTTLFASGKRAFVAIERSKDPRKAIPLADSLAELFGTARGVSTHYEPAKLAIDGPATTDHVLATLGEALAQPGAPLLVYIGCHGDRGERPRDSSLALWGGWPLRVDDLASELDAESSQRPARFVITSCYGGGFADLVYRGAEAEREVREVVHCGLFAAPWDEEASGCDPNPDRRTHESYALHFLQALSSRDRTGKQVSGIDLDGDERISLLEAHSWARIHARSFDMPTTTSERYLREIVDPKQARQARPEFDREEARVVSALGQALELDTADETEKQLSELEGILSDVASSVAEAQHAEEDAYYALRISLLERWPLLDHPWEARTRALLKTDGSMIRRVLEESDAASVYAHATREFEQLLAQQDQARVARARVSRLARAYETARLVGELKARGGAGFQTYQALRACERFIPDIRTTRRGAQDTR